MKYLTEKRLLYAIIAFLGLLLLFSNPSCKSCNNSNFKSDTVIVQKTDTQWIKQDTVFISVYKPKVVKTITHNNRIPKASKNYDSLKNQYDSVSQKFYSTNIVKDNIKLKDSTGRIVGNVNINDSVNQNVIIGRDVDYQLEFPIITNTIIKTITKTSPSKRQFYIGGQITGNQKSLINGGILGLIYKDRKERIYTINAGGITYQNLVYPQFLIGTYWKIGKK